MPRRALLVVACPGTGGSALADAMVRAGAHPGRDLAAAPAGAEGACAPLVALNERLLAVLGLRPDSLAPLPDRWLERPAIQALAAEADRLVADQFGACDRAVAHSGHLALTAPFWRDRFTAAGFHVGAVLTVHRPEDAWTAVTEAPPDTSASPEKVLALWLHHLIEAERATRSMPRALVACERFPDDAAGVLDRIAADARFPIPVDGPEREAAIGRIRLDGERRLAGGRGACVATASGLDILLAAAYHELAALPAGVDPGASIQALEGSAQGALRQVIAPWLAHELEIDREHGEALALVAADATARIAALEAELAAARSLAEARDRERDVLVTEVDAHSRAGARGADTSLAGLQGDVERIARALAEAPAREKALADELVSLQRELSDERVTIARLTDSLERERQSAAALERRAAEAEARLDGLLAEIEDARSVERAWHEHHGAQAREIEQATASLDLAAKERDLLRAELDAARREIERQRPELESLRADLRIVDHDRGALAARAQAVDAAAAALREELARRAGAEASLLAERDRIAKHASAQGERIAALERDLARRHSEAASLATRHDGLARLIAALETTWLGRRALSSVRGTAR